MDELSVVEPMIGMMFNSIEDGWKFWERYGKAAGFGVRKHYTNKNKDGLILNDVYVCSKEGHREEDKRVLGNHRWQVRTGCEAKINVGLDKESGNYFVKALEISHNHELEPPETTHMLRSHRRMSEAQAYAVMLANDSGLKPKATYELMSREPGGRLNVGYVMEDQKTYLRSIRKKNMMYGELGSMMRYFVEQKKKIPSFFHAEQFDSEGLVTNIFWCDSRMTVDYLAFGDVVTFDTTYGTNKELRPVAVFTGFNHHRKMVIFGAALLYDETTESFMWLFDTFVQAHGGKKPRTIFTDQDAAMAKGLACTWLETYHGLCTWHLMQNGIKHLGCRMKDDDSMLLKDLKKCMFEYLEEAEFEMHWKIMLQTHNLEDNDWLKRTYQLKRKWAKCYMKSVLTLGIRSTQLSESLNSDLKDHLNCQLHITDFFNNFDRVVADKRYRELEAEFKARQRIPPLAFSDTPLLHDALKRYTPAIFAIFQKELSLSMRVMVKSQDKCGNNDEYIVGVYGVMNREFKVLFDPTDKSISCSCMKFESMGVLCCHALKVFIILYVMEIPEQYIMSRWTRGIKTYYTLNEWRPTIREDATEWVKRVQSQLLRMTYQASLHDDTRAGMEMMIQEYNNKLFESTSKTAFVEEHNVMEIVGDEVRNMKGLKKKEGRKVTRRYKPAHELRRGKAKQPLSRNNMSSQALNYVNIIQRPVIDLNICPPY